MHTKNKVILITGGASGLGAACSEYFVGKGASVLIADINPDSGKTLEAKLGKKAKFVATDVTSEATVQTAVDSALKEFGAIHVLINCAGVGTPGKVLDKENKPQPLASFAKVIEINLIGSINAIRIAAAAMTKNKPEEGERGVIINTASVAAFEGQIGQVAYSASKGGIVSMALPLARELARHGIRVNTISPGIFETPMLAGLNEEVRVSLGAQVPFPSRLGRAQEYAMLAEQIVENQMLNAAVLRLDGALRMGAK